MIAFIWNVRLNSKTRLNRLIDIVTQVSLLDFKHISIRLRGDFKHLAQEEISQLIPENKFNLFVGENYKDWKMNTLEQVMMVDTPYYCLLQEDYLFMSTPDQTNYYLNLCIQNDIDYAMLFDLNFVGTIIDKRDSEFNFDSDSKFLKIYDYNRLTWDDQAKNYHGSMIGWPSFFKKNILIKILNSPKPYFKKFPPYSPFNFEKGVNATWLLPIRMATPRFELMACIDDDIRVPGSSLMSRNLYPLNIIRADEQYTGTHAPGRFFLRYFSLLVKRCFNSSSIASKIKSPRLLCIYSNFMKFFFKCLTVLDSLKFSFTYLINRLTNSGERRLRNKSKINLNFQSY